MPLRILLALALVVGAIRPPGALAHAGDVVLRKSSAVPGQVQAALPVAGAAGGPVVPPPRRPFRHFITGEGFDPARSITSAERNRRGRIDVFTRAKEVARSRERLGPAAFRQDEIRSFPGQDTVRIAFLRVDFLNDREGPRSTGDGRFELAPRDTMNRPFDPTPHNKAFFASHGEALRRYWDAQTAGRTVIETTVFPTAGDSAFHLSDMADYGPWKFSPEIYQAAVKLFRDCLVAADTTEAIAWSTFDRVMIVHAGSDLQSDLNQDSPLDIPTFTIGVADTDVVVLGSPSAPDSIFGAVIQPETIRQDGYEGVVNAVYTHESGHLIYGYRDVYDVVTGLPTVGYWDLMDVGNLLGNGQTFPNGVSAYVTGLIPPSVDPWQKRLIYPDVPAARFPVYGADETLGNSSEAYEVMQVPLSGEEYLLLENRLDDLNGNGQITLQRDSLTGVILGPSDRDPLEYDFLVPGPGILAWHVDESVADYFGPRADPGFGLNVNRGRFGLQIIEADGLDDLGDFDSPFALGVPSDTWKAGPRSKLNWDTVPRLRTNSRTNPHLDLTFTSPPGPTMTLQVQRLWDVPGWPVTVVQPPLGISPAVSPIGDEGTVHIAWAGGDSAVHVREPDGSGAFAGGTSDVAFKAPGPLGVLAVVPGTVRNLYAVARTDTVASGGLVYVLDLNKGSVEVTPYAFPSRVTAGPIASQPDAGLGSGCMRNGKMLVGLENGRVCLIDTNLKSVSDLGGIGAGAVTGLAWDRIFFAASGTSGGLMAGLFGGDFGLCTPSTWLKEGVLPAGRHLQPIFVRSSSPPSIRIVLVDRTAGSARTFAYLDTSAQPIEPWQGRELGEPVGPPAVADLDADGLPEIAFTSASGRVGYWNLNGTTSPGWPPEVEREGFVSRAGPLPLLHPGLSADPLVIASLGNGVVVAFDRARRNVEGFPLGTSVGARGTPALDLAGPILYIAGGDTLLYAFHLVPNPTTSGAPPAGFAWTAEGGGPTRSWADPTVYGSTVGGSPTAILDGQVRAYPNPARQQPITFAFRLREPGRITLSVYDASARLVERIERDGSASDNAITWDPAGRTSGLYVARIEVPGQVVTTPFALIR